MSWATALSDLRFMLSDNVTDKPAYRKACLGIKNGTNKSFKVFEYRILTDLSIAAAPLGVFVNDVFVTTTYCSLDTGDFTLSVAPLEGDRVEASYYSQWFRDDELQTFLRMACNSLGLGDTYANIGNSLQPAALKYATADCYQELAVRFSRMISERYRMEDLPKESLHGVTESWLKLSTQYRKDAISLRDDNYKRQGQALAPLFGTISGNVRDVKPNR